MVTLRVRLENVGEDLGPFNVFSNIDGYSQAVLFNIPRNTMIEGVTADFPDGTVRIRVVSVNSKCNALKEADI